MEIIHETGRERRRSVSIERRHSNAGRTGSRRLRSLSAERSEKGSSRETKTKSRDDSDATLACEMGNFSSNIQISSLHYIQFLAYFLSNVLLTFMFFYKIHILFNWKVNWKLLSCGFWLISIHIFHVKFTFDKVSRYTCFMFIICICKYFLLNQFIAKWLKRQFIFVL